MGELIASTVLNGAPEHSRVESSSFRHGAVCLAATNVGKHFISALDMLMRARFVVRCLSGAQATFIQKYISRADAPPIVARKQLTGWRRGSDCAAGESRGSFSPATQPQRRRQQSIIGSARLCSARIHLRRESRLLITAASRRSRERSPRIKTLINPARSGAPKFAQSGAQP